MGYHSFALIHSLIYLTLWRPIRIGQMNDGALVSLDDGLPVVFLPLRPGRLRTTRLCSLRMTCSTITATTKDGESNLAGPHKHHVLLLLGFRG